MNKKRLIEVIDEHRNVEKSAKNTVLQIEHICQLIKSYLFYTSRSEFVSHYFETYLRTSKNNKHIPSFYKKTVKICKLLIANNKSCLYFKSIQCQYTKCMFRNIRYNLFDNEKELIVQNTKFCLSINRLIKNYLTRTRLQTYTRHVRFHSFKHVILNVNNCIHHKKSKHNEILMKYSMQLSNTFGRSIIRMYY